MNILIKLKYIFREMRVGHWFKNVYVLFPLIWGAHPTFHNLLTLFLGFVALSFTSSIVYIFNDIKDLEFDKIHPEKKHRPLVSGKITMQEAKVTMIILGVLVCGLLFMLNSMQFVYIVAAILLLNFVYTNFAKKIPFVELFLIGVLYVLRTISGFVLLSIPISIALVITVFFLVTFVRAGQRLIELKHYGTEAREVLKRYSVSLIRIFLVVTLMLTMIFYFITVTYLTGPIIYTSVVMFFSLSYLHEIFISDGVKHFSDDVSKIFLSRKILWVPVVITLIVVLAYYILY